MKKALALILAVLIIVSIATSAMAYTMYVYTSNGKPLNMRDAPASSGPS